MSICDAGCSQSELRRRNSNLGLAVPDDPVDLTAL